MEQLLCAFVQSKVTDMLQESRAGRLHVEALKVTVLNVEAVEQQGTS